MNSNKQNLINKIIYRSQYRGTKEMDLFINKFVKSIIQDLDLNLLEELNKVVNLDDEDLKIKTFSSRGMNKAFDEVINIYTKTNEE